MRLRWAWTNSTGESCRLRMSPAISQADKKVRSRVDTKNGVWHGIRSRSGAATLTWSAALEIDAPGSWPGAYFIGNSYAAFDREELDFFEGTFWPFLRASESPMAIACFRLFTLPPLPPLPDLSVPLFLRRTALATVLLA